MIDYSKYPGLTVEILPSGNERIRVRVEGDISRKITIPSGLSDEDFNAAYNEARKGVATNYTPMRLNAMRRRPGFMSNIYVMLSRAKDRARRKGIKFDLTPEDVIEILEKQDGKCAVSGMFFDTSKYPRKGGAGPFRMSLDRINNAGGYTRDNVRVTTVIVNMARLNWSDDDFHRMCAAVARNSRARTTLGAQYCEMGHHHKQDIENKEEKTVA
ncbi:hypothetical protein [Oricola thermophila]|uniref:Uncharacterized protein n=1 Tax=Oricola thermophila TaxID=2742145 RepID=A0A6N1VB90_9HYPH|nr:hypothetical protein [Oricola thermophila]QKV17813.1 hypothetical protein HTY61_04750 [Oricola thermophila]